MTRKEEIEKGIDYFKANTDRMSSLYKEMYREDICLNCKGSIEYAFKKMYKDRDRVIPTIQMKRGKVIDTHTWNDERFPKGHFNYHNTSDELAKLFIEVGYREYFI